MSLIGALSGAEGVRKLPVHQFWAALVELSLGELTEAQIKTYFEMTPEEQTDFDWLVGKYQASQTKERFLELMHVLFMLAEQGTPGYTDEADITARINRIG